MTPSEDCINLVKQFEGCKLSPYLDAVGVATIGFGSTFYLNGTPVTMDDPPIDQDTADQLLTSVLNNFWQQLEPHITYDSLTQGMVDSLGDFAYNEGVHALENSTLLSLLNQGDIDGAADQFLVWDRAGGKILPGLLRRRQAEQALFKS